MSANRKKRVLHAGFGVLIGGGEDRHGVRAGFLRGVQSIQFVAIPAAQMRVRHGNVGISKHVLGSGQATDRKAAADEEEDGVEGLLFEQEIALRVHLVAEVVVRSVRHLIVERGERHRGT